MRAGRRAGETEFGGKGGIIQREIDGHSMEADKRGGDEQAMILRSAGLREPDVEVTETYVPGEGIEIVKVPMTEEKARARLEEKR